MDGAAERDVQDFVAFGVSRGCGSQSESKDMRRSWRLRRCHAACGRRVPLPPQQLLIMAAALSITAVVVSMMIATGDLPWGEGRGGRYG